MTTNYVPVLAKFSDFLDEIVATQRTMNLPTPELAQGIVDTVNGDPDSLNYTALMLATAIQRLAYVDHP